MTPLYILSLTPIGITAVLLADTVTPGYLQYGALGVVFFMVTFLCGYIWHLSSLLTKQTEKMTKVIEDNTASNNRISQALGDRPCLKDDSRIRE